jgi:hypothetical protein
VSVGRATSAAAETATSLPTTPALTRVERLVLAGAGPKQEGLEALVGMGEGTGPVVTADKKRV